MQPSTPTRRFTSYAFVVAVLCLVSDGWSGKPSPLIHQIILIPLTVAFGLGLRRLLASSSAPHSGREVAELPTWSWALLAICQLLATLMFVVESVHFARFGYRLSALPCELAALAASAGWLLFALRRDAANLFAAVLTTYAAGAGLAIACFPLNYLRSDMLPVISWADERLVHHLNPYQTIHVGGRLYDFPYLPGMLLAFAPFQALHLDLRIANLVYLLAAAVLIYRTARPVKRFEAAVLLGAFLLCPFLQYRHDLYLEPHWFLVTCAIVLMQRRHFAWAALLWGMSCAVYQLSWVIVPFVFLNALWRRGTGEVAKTVLLTSAGAMLLLGPFARVASHQVAHNTVGQWSHLPHALADPINLSFWLTYLIHPDQLKWVQAAVLVALFSLCVIQRRCRTLVDTVRWMSCALATFIPLNVLVDGYFYLTLLLLLLLYVLLANNWWSNGVTATQESDAVSV